MIVFIVGIFALTAAALTLGFVAGWLRRDSLQERRGLRR